MLESPLCLFVFALRLQLSSLWYVDDSNFLLGHALNRKLQIKKERQT